MLSAATGNSSKMSFMSGKGKGTIEASLKRKKAQKKTTLAVGSLVGLVALVLLVYTLYQYKDVLARGGAEAAKQLGPLVSRILPAIVLGGLSMLIGPEGLIGGVPLGLIFGPEIMGFLGGMLGGGSGGKVAQVARVAQAAAPLME